MTPGAAAAVEPVRRGSGSEADGPRAQHLRRAAVVFLAAVVVHGADHVRRGVHVVSGQVTSAGTVQFLLAVVAVALVFRRHPWAPTVAVIVGFTSAIGFAAAHLLPHWSSFSDPFTGSRVASHVTALSWATAIFEIGADVAFGWAGLRALIAGREGALRARRVRVPEHEPLLADASYDYADAFEIHPRAEDPRSAEDFARSALEHAPWLVRQTVVIAHRYVLRLQLGPMSSPEHVLGWKIVTAEPEVICLEAVSPLLGRGVIVARRPEPTRATITTYVFFARPGASRVLWVLVGPLHRWVAPYLLERAVAADISGTRRLRQPPT